MNDKIKNLLAETSLGYIPVDLFFTTEKKQNRQASARNKSLQNSHEIKIKRYNYVGRELRIPYKPISRLIRDESNILLHSEVPQIP